MTQPPQAVHVQGQEGSELNGTTFVTCIGQGLCNDRQISHEMQERLILDGPDRFDNIPIEDDFQNVAITHVQTMLSKLVVEHRSTVCALHYEIGELRQKLVDVEANPMKEMSGPGVLDKAVPMERIDVAALNEAEPCIVDIDGNIAGMDNTNIEGEGCEPANVHLEFAECDPSTVDRPVTKNANEERPYDSHGQEEKPNRKPHEHYLTHELHAAGVVEHDVKWSDVDSHMKAKVRTHTRSFERGWCHCSRLCVSNFVLGSAFEIISGGVIVCNTIMMAMEQQYNGFGIGNTIVPGLYPTSKEDTWPGADTVFKVGDIVFNTLFTVELLLRFFANGFHSIRIAWMWFDTIIVTLGLIDLLTDGGGIGIDPTMMRLCRLVRLVRLLKVFKKMTQFDALFLLVKSIKASVQALFWSLLLLTAVQMGTALFLGQVLTPVMTDKEKTPKVREDLFMYFGTFSRTMMTMFEITLANWVPSCRFLMNEVHEAFFLFYLVYRIMFCFAVLKVIAAVFISETNRVLASDVELTMMKAQREKAEFTEKLKRVLKTLDEDGNGQITYHEVQIFLADPSTPLLLTTIGFDRMDVEKIFFLVQEDGAVEIDKFVRTVASMKGLAKTVDLQNVFKLVHRLDMRLAEAFQAEEEEDADNPEAWLHNGENGEGGDNDQHQPEADAGDEPQIDAAQQKDTVTLSL